MSLSVVSSPVAEPVSLATFKNHLRLETNDEDDICGAYLTAARAYAENITCRAFMPQTLLYALDGFPRASREAWQYERGFHNFRLAIDLPRPACISVQSISYVDVNGFTQILDPSLYQIDLASEPARIVLNLGNVWPQTLPVPGAVKVVYLAGSYVTPLTDEVTPTDTAPSSLVLRTDAVAGAPISVSTNAAAVSGFSVQSPNVLTLLTPAAGQTFEVSYYAAAVRPCITAAILLLASHFYRNREAVSEVQMKEVPLTVSNLLAQETAISEQVRL